MFNFGDFKSSSGTILPFKIECDDLTAKDIACLASVIAGRFQYRSVLGVPTGGLLLAEALMPYVATEGPVLIVDDVLTTGKSMEKYRTEDSIGVVIFSRGHCPAWIYPMFRLDPLFV